MEQRVLMAATPPGTYDFGVVAGKPNVKATVIDADGTKSVFALAGIGTGHVTVSNSGAIDVVLDPPTANSNLTISAAGGNGRMRLSTVTANGSLGKLIAPGVDIGTSLS